MTPREDVLALYFSVLYYLLEVCISATLNIETRRIVNRVALLFRDLSRVILVLDPTARGILTIVLPQKAANCSREINECDFHWDFAGQNYEQRKLGKIIIGSRLLFLTLVHEIREEKHGRR